MVSFFYCKVCLVASINIIPGVYIYAIMSHIQLYIFWRVFRVSIVLWVILRLLWLLAATAGEYRRPKYPCLASCRVAVSYVR